MTKSVFAAAAALLFIPLSAPGASAGQAPGTFPLISGSYLISVSRVCQPVLNVSYTNLNGVNVVTGVGLSSLTPSNVFSGHLSATNTNGSGTFAFNDTGAQSDPIIVQDNQGGEWGTILQSGKGSGTVNFTQTSKTLSIPDNSGTSIYNIYYGLVKNGIAVSAVFAGLDDRGCMESGSIAQAK